MKRSECTVEKLKALGYTAKHADAGSWRTKAKMIGCTEKQAEEVFAVVVDVVKNGGSVEIRQDNYNYVVKVYVKELDFSHTIGRDHFFLSRPMTEAERLEADLYTGRGKDWDYVE